MFFSVFFFLMLDFSCFKSQLSVLKLVLLKFKLNPSHVAHILVVSAETGGMSSLTCIVTELPTAGRNQLGLRASPW